MESRLYNTSPYLSEWQTQVIDIVKKGEKHHVVLVETAFYPEGGGQLSDRGTIGGRQVEDVYEENGLVFHVMSEVPAKGTVTCNVDFDRRFDLMQQHTGQHLLSAVLFNQYDVKTSSFHMGEQEVSIDVSVPEMPAQMLREVEERVNRHITSNLPVKTHVVTPEEAKNFPNRKIPPAAGIIRIVEIDAVDFSPCCGTHVTRTGEIGLIKIINKEKRGNETRLYFKCGMRALHDYQHKQDIITELSRRYRAMEPDILSRVEAQDEQTKATRKELAELKERMSVIDAREMASSAKSRLIVRSFDDKKFEDLTLLSKYILEHGNFIVVLSSVPDKRLLFARGEGFNVECGKILKESLPAYGGKGGGKPNWANAGFGDVDTMRKFEAFLVDGPLRPFI